MTQPHAQGGVLPGGLPYLAAGTGPPVVVFPGLDADNADPTGRQRRFTMRAFRPLTRHFTVYVINRKPGLAPGSTLRELAGHYAHAVERHFAGPVDMIGVSTGGSIAQIFAIEYPHLVHRLVLFASACRLSAYGRHVQRAQAAHARAGHRRRAQAAAGPALAASRLGALFFTALLWATGARMSPPDPNDLLVTIAAEDAFDATPDLPRITAPTLVIGGGRDRFYGAELFRQTARRIPGARLLLYPRKGHVATISHRPAVQKVLRFLT
jgi:pimeloyl-ACP methyl ester carboxylesterase